MRKLTISEPALITLLSAGVVIAIVIVSIAMSSVQKHLPVNQFVCPTPYSLDYCSTHQEEMIQVQADRARESIK